MTDFQVLFKAYRYYKMVQKLYFESVNTILILSFFVIENNVFSSLIQSRQALKRTINLKTSSFKWGWFQMLRAKSYSLPVNFFFWFCYMIIKPNIFHGFASECIKIIQEQVQRSSQRNNRWFAGGTSMCPNGFSHQRRRT